MECEVIATEQSCIGQFNYISTDMPVPVRLHYFPQHQCPTCFNIGQQCFKSVDGWVLVCGECGVKYMIKLERRT